jgi:hypothetical protein
MIFHFVNILTWEFFAEDRSEGSIIFIDGFLLQLAIFLTTGKWFNKKSGLNYYHNNQWSDSTLFLTSDGVQGFRNELSLPIWDDIKSLNISTSFLESISKFENIVIGISSPKQDFLALEIAKVYPNTRIYCLGAALYTRRVLNSEYVFVTMLTMLLNNPRRFVLKVFSSGRSFVSTMFSKRDSLRLFTLHLESYR